jgi:hypothetical protein
MSNYFSYFPKVDYDIDKSGTTHNVVNILRRFVVHAKVKDRTAVYYDYLIQEGDRPDTIAGKYYDDPKLDWVVLMVNEIFDPNFDWPLHYTGFKNFIIDKYTTVALAHSTTHELRRITRAESTNSLGDFLPEISVVVDQETFDALTSAEQKTVTKYDYEFDLNESKRSIRVLDKNHLTKILDEASKIF